MRNSGKHINRSFGLLLTLAGLTGLLVLAGHSSNQLSPLQRSGALTAIAAVLPQLPAVCPGNIAAQTMEPFGKEVQIGPPCFPRTPETFAVARGKISTIPCPGVPDCIASVTAYDVCLQDDKTNNLLQINSVTGHYKFTD